MVLESVLKKTSALFAAMLIMAAVWGVRHVPGAGLQMVVFAFLSSAALCSKSDFNVRTLRCIQLVTGAALAQLLIGSFADYPMMRIIVSMLVSFFVLALMPERQSAVIVLLIGYLSLLSPPGLTAALNRCADIALAGAAVLAVTTLCNLFEPGGTENAAAESAYTLRQAVIITAELTVGSIIFQWSNHEQMAWIMLTVIFVRMAENPQNSIESLVKQRIAAVPLGIIAGGIYLACFDSTSVQMIYIVPFSGMFCFFMLYLKNDYFIFTFLFIFTLTVFTDWMLGSSKRFYFTDIMLSRSVAAMIGGALLLLGKKFMQKESVS